MTGMQDLSCFILHDSCFCLPINISYVLVMHSIYPTLCCVCQCCIDVTPLVCLLTKLQFSYREEKLLTAQKKVYRIRNENMDSHSYHKVLIAVAPLLGKLTVTFKHSLATSALLDCMRSSMREIACTTFDFGF